MPTWAPLLEGSSPFWAIVACAAVVAAIAAASWQVRVPGAVTLHEEAIASRGHRAAPLVLAGPIFVLVGLFMLVFPPSSERALYLQSRAISGPAAHRDALLQGMLDLRSTRHEATREWLDVGPVADQIFRRIRTQPELASALTSQNAARELLPDLILDIVESEEPAIVSTANLAAARGPSPDLPTWLVESIEISVLRLVAEQRNVSLIGIVAADRSTRLGYSWSDSVGLLESTAGRADPVEVLLSPRDGPSPGARVHSIRRASFSGTEGLQLLVTLEVPPPPASGSHPPIQIIIRSPDGTESPLAITPSPSNQWSYQPKVVDLPAVIPAPGAVAAARDRPWELIQPNSGAPLVFRPMTGAAPLHLVFTGANAARWAASWSELSSLKMGGNQPVDAWFQSMRLRGIRLEDVLVESATGSGSGAPESIEITEGPGVVWLYPSWARAEGRALAKNVALPSGGALKRAQRTEHLTPGLASIGGLPLDHIQQSDSELLDARAAAFVMFRVDTRFESASKAWVPVPPSRRHELLARREPDPHKPTAPLVEFRSIRSVDRPGNIVVVRAALDQLAQLPAAGASTPHDSDLVPLAATWSLLIEAADLARTALPPDVTSGSQSALPPLPLADTSTISRARASAIGWAALPLLLGLSTVLLIRYSGIPRKE